MTAVHVQEIRRRVKVGGAGPIYRVRQHAVFTRDELSEGGVASSVPAVRVRAMNAAR